MKNKFPSHLCAGKFCPCQLYNDTTTLPTSDDFKELKEQLKTYQKRDEHHKHHADERVAELKKAYGELFKAHTDLKIEFQWAERKLKFIENSILKVFEKSKGEHLPIQVGETLSIPRPHKFKAEQNCQDICCVFTNFTGDKK